MSRAKLTANVCLPPQLLSRLLLDRAEVGQPSRYSAGVSADQVSALRSLADSGSYSLAARRHPVADSLSLPVRPSNYHEVMP
jgi:hypothetical protein